MIIIFPLKILLRCLCGRIARLSEVQTREMIKTRSEEILTINVSLSHKNLNSIFRGIIIALSVRVRHALSTISVVLDNSVPESRRVPYVSPYWIETIIQSRAWI